MCYIEKQQKPINPKYDTFLLHKFTCDLLMLNDPPVWVTGMWQLDAHACCSPDACAGTRVMASLLTNSDTLQTLERLQEVFK